MIQARTSTISHFPLTHAFCHHTDSRSRSPRSGGAAQGDAFQKREQADENYYVKQQERQKLEQLRKKIADQEEKIAKDREEADKIVTGGKS